MISPELSSLTENAKLVDKVRRKVATLSQGSIIFFDIDGTAVDSINGRKIIRTEFVSIYEYIRQSRPDLELYTISYRSATSASPELGDYSFAKQIYVEDFMGVVESTAKEELGESVINYLSNLDGFADDYQLAQDLIFGSPYKVQFLLLLFGDEVKNVVLIDDGIDGRYAETLGFGIHFK